MNQIVPGLRYCIFTSQGVQLSKAERKAGKSPYVTKGTIVIAREPIPLPAGNLELWQVEHENGEHSNVWASQLKRVD